MEPCGCVHFLQQRQKSKVKPMNNNLSESLMTHCIQCDKAFLQNRNTNTRDDKYKH